MTVSNRFRILVFVFLIILSFLGFFENQAFEFLKDVSKKNLDFLAVVSELKILLTGLSSIQIPFVSGHSTGVNQSLDKIQTYLLFTNAVSFIQLMLVAISKSWVIKTFMIILFLLTLWKKTERTSVRILILTLALTPGLSFFTVSVKKISEVSSIDFGDTYLQKLKGELVSLKAEHATLMKAHTLELTKLDGQKGHIFKKIKEDVSYDFARLDNDFKGAYTKTRELIQTAGHEVVSKVAGFCSMVVFCLFILPLGYSLIIYVLFNSLFKGAEMNQILDVLLRETKKSLTEKQ